VLGAIAVVLISRAWNRESLGEMRIRREFINSRSWGIAQAALKEFVEAREVLTARFQIGNKRGEMAVRKGLAPCLRYLGIARQARLLGHYIRVGIVSSRIFGFSALACFAGIAASQLYLHLAPGIEEKLIAGGVIALALCFIITVLTEACTGILSALESWIRSREPEDA
jgi:hypothetical protein